MCVRVCVCVCTVANKVIIIQIPIFLYVHSSELLSADDTDCISSFKPVAEAFMLDKIANSTLKRS